ncbi:hypothetical protein ACPOL_0792 [Acidisarcina polymorpha]|uniref:Uncharacterized protein n=1 Tax=Acidisarcina polymorpha TaxID=2211140 RepID=A0A2Z5FTK3_9BACT|nr:hypothetical protein ACPOL_0792 [Acidisarcina polymorpha]
MSRCIAVNNNQLNFDATQPDKTNEVFVRIRCPSGSRWGMDRLDEFGESTGIFAREIYPAFG